MGIEKIATGIEQAKLGYMEAVCGAAERAKAEIKAANGDRSRSGRGYRARAASLGISRFRTPAHAATTRIRASFPPSGRRGLRARDPIAPFRATPFRRLCA